MFKPALSHIVFVATLAATPFLRAAEVPDSAHLLFLVDSSEQPLAREKAGIGGLNAGQGVEVLIDTSGKRCDFLQPLAECRPALVTDGKVSFLRFDGKDDFLFLKNQGEVTSEMTVFVLAAPRANPGYFPALFATAATKGNDYSFGLNLDLGALPTERLSIINIESAGTAGMKNLLDPSSEQPFGGFHVFTIRATRTSLELFFDGRKNLARDRAESAIGLDRMVLGARYYSNDPAVTPYVQGFLKGDIAAVIAYDHLLDDDARGAVEMALQARVAGLEALAKAAPGPGLETLAAPPLVQMLVPGFTVQEVPLKLGNLTNLRYRHDGKLVALGYDGRVHLLTDSDGDGIPDKSEIWWDKAPLSAPIGLELLPAGDPRGEGAFVASKAKLSLLLDKDRDGTAEEEIVAATGWPETTHGVDSLGVAVDPKDGSIYFSIGCANFANAYIRDADGKAHYDINSPRGTVQRLSADLKKRETVCTGVRFLCAMAFNSEGDLFATDQEGATWLPNGNPLDELLHIVPGRHYGFPPRHPRDLPGVIDEPPVTEYGPQHQSTCGMVFNLGVNGGPAFGPAIWHGDALICGESRGKIWRTKLAKTPEGYASQTQLIACLNLLTVDACVTPSGDLLVACHSGPPDWGTGPAGAGRLFLIRWAGRTLPQPVIAWASAPDEFRIAFDAPLQSSDLAAMKAGVRVEAGEYVSAGDRFETVRPGYQVVRDQLAAPRRKIAAESLQLTPDSRTLVLRVPPQVEPVNYAVTLPLPESWRVESPVAQVPEMDVALNLHGIEAAAETHAGRWKIMLPHPSLTVAKMFTNGSADHGKFFAQAPSAMDLQGRVDAGNIFQPATQPIATLDWDAAADAFANRRMVLRDLPAGRDVPVKPQDGRLSPFNHRLTADSRIVFALDDKLRPLPPGRLYAPWALAGIADNKPAAAPAARTDVKGNWLHGRRIYFGKGTCWTCHILRGEGLNFGPDLGNLVYRDRESVLADIMNPSATISPDHAGVQVKLKDGTTLSGILGASDVGKISLRLPAGASAEYARADIASITPMATSLMPDALHTALSDIEKEDLLTFLLTNPLPPSSITRTDPGPPPSRKLSEVMPFLPPVTDAGQRPLHILLSAGTKDHGVNEHDYPLWLERWSKLLAMADNVTVTTCMDFPSREQLAAADVAVFYSNNGGWGLPAAIQLDAFQKRGGGLVYLHWGIEGHQHPKDLAERIGLAFSASAFRHGEMNLVFTDIPHPVTTGFSAPLRFIDETYWKLHGDPAKISILGTSLEDNAPTPQLWSREVGESRTIGCIPGHYTWTMDDPFYRVLVLRSICWAAHESNTDRLAELVLIGARFTQGE